MSFYSKLRESASMVPGFSRDERCRQQDDAAANFDVKEMFEGHEGFARDAQWMGEDIGGQIL
ncbi:hypothetical protein [Paraburkholderia antibiotica]|uniref:Uncharacterized protein n=1 Tax=Paraburkholderia antibiotica TaxID=2728839 RepID=A0A7X9X7D9_9BURK|nr:hypothetical protein [Paraburkholderia antibiotica]NML32760.1 hypothetical protein [Paraburkholderia antibiotica]